MIRIGTVQTLCGGLVPSTLQALSQRPRSSPSS